MPTSWPTSREPCGHDSLAAGPAVTFTPSTLATDVELEMFWPPRSPAMSVAFPDQTQ